MVYTCYCEGLINDSCRCLISDSKHIRARAGAGSKGQGQLLALVSSGALAVGVLSCFPFTHTAVEPGDGSQASGMRMHSCRGRYR